MTQEQIGKAVAECVNRCLTSQAPMICVAEFLLRLRDVEKWPLIEADQVGRLALRMIRDQTSGDNQAG